MTNRYQKDPFVCNLRNSLKDVMAKHSTTLDGWKLEVKNKKSKQSLFLAKPDNSLKAHQERTVADTSYSLKIFVTHAHKEFRGMSTWKINPHTNLTEQIEKAYANAMLVKNKYWQLPELTKLDYPTIKNADPLIIDEIAIAHSTLTKEINSESKSLERVIVNSAELYTHFDEYYFETNLGLNGNSETSKVYFEMAMEKKPKPNKQEVLKYKETLGIKDGNFGEFINEIKDETLGVSSSQLPKNNENATILISKSAISDLIASLTSQTNAYLEYEKMPHLKQDDKIYTGEKANGSDKLSVTLDPTSDFMIASSAFTQEGFISKKASIIADDKILTQTISHRIGQLLGKDANHISGNVIVPKGSKTKEQMMSSQKDFLEIITFSSLLIDDNTLSWSSEIKLAKLHKNGQVVATIKGGVVSGNIKENLRDFTFSTETNRINTTGYFSSGGDGYIGPKYMMIRSGVKIAGEA